MAAFTTFQDADQEVRALSFILSSLETSGVISFDAPIERDRPEIAKPLQKIAKVLVRRKIDNVAIGALVRSNTYAAIALDSDVFQLCGSINPEAEDKNKTEVSFKDEEIFGRAWSNGDVIGFVVNYANHKSAVLSFRSHVYLLQKLWRQAVEDNTARTQLLIYVLVMAYDKNEARYNQAVSDLDIQPPADGTIPDISFDIDGHVDTDKIQHSLPPGISLGRQVKADLELRKFTGSVYKFVATYITITINRAHKNLQDLSKKLPFGSRGNTTPIILTTEISEERQIVALKVYEVLYSQVAYYRCMKHLKPLLPCLEKALDTYNEIWKREASSYARLDQDSRLPVTYGPALVKLLKEPLIHINGAYSILKFARRKPPTPLAKLFNGTPQSKIEVLEHRWPQERTMANVEEALENAFAGSDKVSREVLRQVKELITCHENHFVKLNAIKDSSRKEWDGKLKFTGTVHCEAIVAVDLVKHLKDRNPKPLPLLGISRRCCFVCAWFLHEIYSRYIPGFDGKVSVARESNRVWPISLPEQTDVPIANKIIDQLRDLLHRKLMQEDGKIQMFYDQIQHDKRRMSHGELSSSGDESIQDEEEEENIDNDVFKLVEEARAKQKLKEEAMGKLKAEARANLPDDYL
ncbi:uncharacterized protein K441DRAFT_672377 [Cenococcum geophilum 1.58]|uniref:uncharacterized protein n=1 Tax=Cenococcum geophilum 1.58 TaxID=794803 RepID=UPI00358F59E3|nr:hypothetical protein K441DRAFT_672377 [Cenococcum geophilum 1.58]